MIQVVGMHQEETENQSVYQSSSGLNTEEGRRKENSSTWIDDRSRSNLTNKNTFHNESETTCHESLNERKGNIKGKMWREKIRVREREEKKKRLMEVNY